MKNKLFNLAILSAAAAAFAGVSCAAHAQTEYPPSGTAAAGSYDSADPGPAPAEYSTPAASVPQHYDENDTSADPPSRIARLNAYDGSVSFQPAEEDAWVAVDPNRPLTAGDNLWNDSNTRSELHIDSTAIRLAGQTGISFLNMDDNLVRIQLAQGSLNVRLRQLDPGDAFVIEAGNVTVSLTSPGDYRADVRPDGQETIVTVRKGDAQITSKAGTTRVGAGRSLTLTTDSNGQLRLADRSVPPPDDFDTWAQARNVREDHVKSVQYVSPEVVGYQDLDSYGSWSSDPDYGNVWIPSGVSVEWAPYRNGHWVFIAPWGWTWVGSERWGFAPYHYGRWARRHDNRWCWVPGPRAHRPVYGPAFVGFIGGGGASIAVTIGAQPSVGWYVLGPRDVYIPSYRCSDRYVRQVNVYNTTVINEVTVVNVYNNYRSHGGRGDWGRGNGRDSYRPMYRDNVAAVTVVNRDTFINSRRTDRNRIDYSRDRFQRAETSTAARVELRPTRESFVGRDRNDRRDAPKPPAGIVSRWSAQRNDSARRNAVAVDNNRGNVRGNAGANNAAGGRDNNPSRGGTAPRESLVGGGRRPYTPASRIDTPTAQRPDQKDQKADQGKPDRVPAATLPGRTGTPAAGAGRIDNPGKGNAADDGKGASRSTAPGRGNNAAPSRPAATPVPESRPDTRTPDRTPVERTPSDRSPERTPVDRTPVERAPGSSAADRRPAPSPRDIDGPKRQSSDSASPAKGTDATKTPAAPRAMPRNNVTQGGATPTFRRFTPPDKTNDSGKGVPRTGGTFERNDDNAPAQRNNDASRSRTSIDRAGDRVTGRSSLTVTPPSARSSINSGTAKAQAERNDTARSIERSTPDRTPVQVKAPDRTPVQIRQPDRVNIDGGSRSVSKPAVSAPKVETRVEAKPEPKVEARPEPKAQPRAESRPESRPAPQRDGDGGGRDAKAAARKAD